MFLLGISETQKKRGGLKGMLRINYDKKKFRIIIFIEVK